MSNYPPTPSFGGPFSYSQQWQLPPPPASSMPPLHPHNFSVHPDYPTASSQQPRASAGSSSEFNNTANFNTNTRIPGLGGHGPLLPPPPFPFMNQFHNSQLPPPPFPPIPIPPMGYPPIPSPAAHLHSQTDFHNQLPVRSQAPPNSVMGNELAAQNVTTPRLGDNIDREEGELSDRDGRASSHSRTEQASGRKSTFRQPFSKERPDNLRPPHTRSPYNSENEATYGSPQAPKQPGIYRTDGDSSNSHFSSNLSRSKDSYRTVDRSNDASVGSDVALGNQGSPSENQPPRREESGSPYQPPSSIHIEPDEHRNSGETGTSVEMKSPSKLPQAKPTSSDNTDSRPSYLAGKSPAQLRVLAQGALLGLAPHNIRYNELVGEGINPTILKQLYDEVGIKVTSPILDPKAAAGDASKAAGALAATQQTSDKTSPAKAQPESSTREQGTAVQEPTRTMQTATSTSQAPSIVEKATAFPSASTIPTQTETGKPLERKEVIARMLAAKAGKISGVTSSAKPDTAKESSVAGATATKPAEQPSQPAPPSEGQVKEKNKAQTELARQRIEQLKKQGLAKSQQRPQVESPSAPTSQQQHGIATGLVQTPQSFAQPFPSSTLQHPLPERPPEPESVPPARIPGLFMTQSDRPVPGEPSPAAQVSGVDSGPVQTRNVPRKRPRASDFDEPVASTKNYTAVPDNRLIIDISDDEFLHGDNDDGDAMDIDKPGDKISSETISTANSRSSMPRNFPPLTDFPSRKPPIPPHQRAPASSSSQTPHRISDQEDLRLKDLEIKAMRKRIAELEQRKQAKLAASRTQSPGTVNQPASVSENPPRPINETPAATETEQQVHPSVQGDSERISRGEPSLVSSRNRSSSIQTLASMDAAQIENMRSKFLRKKEIESGIPALDAELLKSEARLAEFRKEEERLLAEIAKGKEGRRQLMQELENLGLETQGLTLEELQAAKEELENRERQKAVPVPDQPTSQPAAEGLTAMEDSSFQTGEVEKPPSVSPDRVSRQHSPVASPLAPQTSQEAIDLSTSATGEDVSMDDSVEPEKDTSVSSGSAMDESIDSGRSMSIDQPAMYQPPAPDNAVSEVSQAPKPLVSREASPTATENKLDSLPERPSSIGGTGTPVEAPPSRESSVVSEVYEPPEPEPHPDSADTAYTPPFSPAPPDRVEVEEAVMPSLPPPQPDEALTAQDQEPKPEEGLQLGVLEDGKRSKDFDIQFSPYLSPLRYFKAYRYHPKFLEEVSGGYRSLTYSHNIDPMKAVCPFEAAGGICNDHSCEFQHFRDMSLSDDKILVQMGSLREGKTPEERDNYIAGLKQIINDMRRDKVKDFNTVATEIATYRRRFLQDPSRVLPL
ncbi:hypothetical protein VTN02DRAFT_5700 [Thermoascus thermophilus]